MVLHTTRGLEATLGMLAIGAGLYVLFPGRPTFTAPTAFAFVPDWALGMLLAAHGIGALVSLYYGDIRMCRRSALVSAGIWTALGVGMSWSPPGTLLFVPVALILAASSLWVYVRLRLRYPTAEAPWTG